MKCPAVCSLVWLDALLILYHFDWFSHNASPIFSGLGNKIFSIFPSFWDFLKTWKSCMLAKSIEMVQYCVGWVLPSSSSLFHFSFSFFISVLAHKHWYPANFFNLDKPMPTPPPPPYPICWQSLVCTPWAALRRVDEITPKSLPRGVPFSIEVLIIQNSNHHCLPVFLAPTLADVWCSNLNSRGE